MLACKPLLLLCAYLVFSHIVTIAHVYHASFVSFMLCCSCLYIYLVYMSIPLSANYIQALPILEYQCVGRHNHMDACMHAGVHIQPVAEVSGAGMWMEKTRLSHGVK